MLKKLEDNNKGFSSFVEKGLMFIVLFYLFTFILDLFFLLMTMITANHQLDYVTSKLEYQNGFIGTVKMNDSQWTNSEIFGYINAGLNNIGIDDNEWELSYKLNKRKADDVYIPLYNATIREYDYVTPNGPMVIPSIFAVQHSNLYTISRVKLSFYYEYKFSGMAFKMDNRRSKLTIYNDYQNLFVE